MRRLLYTLLCSLAALATATAQPTPADTARLREQQLEEVVISANSAQRRLGNIQIGAEQMQIGELTRTPSLFGEADIMRSVQLLPGVKSESDASSSFQVRGGTSAQNTILLDDAPVYNVGHMAGLFSAFNDEALSSATLYKGLIPAQLGGATAAVFDINTRTGSHRQWHGSASLGLLSAKAAAEGPLGSRTSVLVTARRSYADIILKQFDDFKDNSLYFYDVNAKLDHRLSQADHLQLSLFASHDKTALEDMISLAWTNLTASLTWLHRWGTDDDNLRTTAYISDYTTDNGLDLLGMNLTFSGFIRQAGLRQNLAQQWGRLKLNAGWQSALIEVKSAEWQLMESHKREQRKAWDNALWVGAEQELSRQLTAQAGLRLSIFANLGGPYYYEVAPDGSISWIYSSRSNRIVKTHVQAEPRLSLVYKPQPQLSLKAGYTRSAQNLHALRNQNTSTPFDRYTMSSNIIEPQVADQVSLGVFAMTPRQDYDLSLETYYRHVSHVLDYRDGVSFSSEIEIERLVLPGQGRGYGAELCLRKNEGRLTGWLAYTLAWQKTQIDGVNGGRWYVAGNDRRHDVDIVASYELSPRWTLGAVWVYNSGQAFTAPSGKYEIIDNYIYYYAERNGYRAPAYHRLDVSATWEKKLRGGRLTRQWVFGIYNLYNRYNPYLINFEDSSNGARTKAVQYSLFGIVPSVAFNLKF